MARAKAGGKKSRVRAKKAPRKKPVARSGARKKKIARPKPRRSAAKTSAPAVASLPAVRPDPVRELAKRIVDLTVAGDDEGCLGLYAATAESVEPGQPPVVGIDAIREKFARFRSLMTGIDGQARNVWVYGNTIIIEWHNKLTFRDSGTTVEGQEIAIHEVENGRIARERFYYDRSGLQL